MVKKELFRLVEAMRLHMEQLAENLRLRLADGTTIVLPIGDAGRRNSSHTFTQFTLGPAMRIAQTGEPRSGSLGIFPRFPFRSFEGIDPLIVLWWTNEPEAESLIEPLEDDRRCIWPEQTLNRAPLGGSRRSRRRCRRYCLPSASTRPIDGRS